MNQCLLTPVLVNRPIANSGLKVMGMAFRGYLIAFRPPHVDGPICLCPSYRLWQGFWTTLLFADISGFTRLSARLNAEQLNTHTNQYFTMLIDVVS